MRAKYTKEIEKDGWTRDIPVGLVYRIACCDCGLVHDLEFRLDRDNQIYMRARRNRRATGQRRRYLPCWASTSQHRQPP
jgi:hypothetical protein